MVRLCAWAIPLCLLFWPRVAVCTSTVSGACISNMKQIGGAVEQWALEHKLSTNSNYFLSDPELLGYLKGSILPICPAGGSYVAGRTVLDLPSCTFHGTLDQAAEAQSALGRVRLRQLYLCAFLIVVFTAMLMAPHPGLTAKARRALSIVMPPLMFLLATQFIILGNPTGLIMRLGEKPAAILTSFGALMGLRLTMRESGWLRIYGSSSVPCFWH